MSSPDWRHAFVVANGIRFHYVTAGEGPMVILLHGFPQFWYAWRNQIPALAEKFRVVAPDLRGYGRTERPPRVDDYRTEILAADVAGLIGALGETQALVVGHDWGGAVAWTLARDYSAMVRRLAVLNCPHPTLFEKALRRNTRQLFRSWYMFFFQLPFLPEWALRFRGGALINRLFKGSVVRKDTFSGRDLLEYRQALLKPGALTSALNYYRAEFRAELRGVSGFPKWLKGAKLSTPTLLIWGEEDQALGRELTEGMDELFEGPFKLAYVPKCGHWVNEEQPALVNDLLLEFLDQAQ